MKGEIPTQDRGNIDMQKLQNSSDSHTYLGGDCDATQKSLTAMDEDKFTYRGFY